MDKHHLPVLRAPAGDSWGTPTPCFRNPAQRKNGRALAIKIAEITKRPPESYPCFHLPLHAPITVEESRVGSRIHWPIPGGEGRKEGQTVERAALAMSAKSRSRCAWNILNSKRQYDSMVLLSWPGDRRPGCYEELARPRKKFLDRLRRKFPGIGYAWFLEFGEESKNPHYHLFLTDEPARGVPTKTRKRRGKNTEFPYGEASDWMSNAWLCSAEIDDSDSARRFSEGGIWEKMRSPEGAARYAAKEGSKRAQKQSDFPIKQWWQVSRNQLPETVRITHISVLEYMEATIGDPVMMSYLWEKVVPGGIPKPPGT